jgi:hypothetical protein
MKLTTKQQRLVNYNNIIVANLSKFKTGSVLSRKDFVKLFNITSVVDQGSYAVVHNSNLKLLKAQIEINVLMRENGLYLKSQDYYTNFLVLDKKATKKNIVRYSSEVDINTSCTTRLETKMKNRVNNKTWGSYFNVPTTSIQNLAHKPSDRHARTIQRVKVI